jgi:hypothetical protein
MLAKCPKCGFLYTITPQHIGTSCQCQDCGQDFILKEDKPLPHPLPPVLIPQEKAISTRLSIFLSLFFVVWTGMFVYLLFKESAKSMENTRSFLKLLDEKNELSTLIDKKTLLFPLFVKPEMTINEIILMGEGILSSCKKKNDLDVTCSINYPVLGELYFIFNNNEKLVSFIFETSHFNFNSSTKEETIKFFTDALIFIYGEPHSKEEKNDKITFFWNINHHLYKLSTSIKNKEIVYTFV